MRMVMQQIPGTSDLCPDDLIVYGWSVELRAPDFAAEDGYEPAGPACIVALYDTPPVPDHAPQPYMWAPDHTPKYLWARAYRLTDEEHVRRRDEAKAAIVVLAAAELDALWLACSLTGDRPLLDKMRLSEMRILCRAIGAKGSVGGAGSMRTWEARAALERWAFSRVEGP